MFLNTLTFLNRKNPENFLILKSITKYNKIVLR